MKKITLFIVCMHVFIAFAKEGDPEFKKCIDASRENSIELVQYTDFQGFNNDRPNGLLQQEVRFNWVTNRGSWIGRDVDCDRENTNLDHCAFQLFRYVTLPYIVFNRIDKTKDMINYPVGDALMGNNDSVMRPYLTTMDIWKYSNLQAGMKFNLMALRIKRFMLQLDGGFSLLRNKPFYVDTFRYGADSGMTAEDMRPVYSFMTRLELNGQTMFDTQTGNVNMSVALGMMWIDLKDDYYKQFDATSVDPFSRIRGMLRVNNALDGPSAAPIYYTSVVLEKKWGANATNAGFFRLNYFYQAGSYDRFQAPYDVNALRFARDDYNNHYLQLQLGVAFDLKEIFQSVGTAPAATHRIDNNHLQ